jgi:uncharacterized protein YndB with AHSA1/START domain
VNRATGRTWEQWIAFIDRHGGEDLDHKGIVKLLAHEGAVQSGWWQQMVTVGYEHAKGRRRTGETADAGFQVGVQRALPLGRQALWELLTSGPGLRTWLGSVRKPTLEPGAVLETRDGTRAEIRTLRSGQRLRLHYQPGARARATTLQLSLSCPRNTPDRTTLRFHHEKLASQTQREQMRAHWRAVLDRLEALAADR